MNKTKTIVITVLITLLAVLILLISYIALFKSWHRKPFKDDNYPDSFFPEVEELSRNGFAYAKHVKNLSDDIYYLEARFNDEKSYTETVDSYLASHKLFTFKVTIFEGVKVIEKKHYERFSFDEKFKDGLYIKGPISTRIIDLSEDTDYNDLYLPVWICDDDTNTMIFMYFHSDDSTSVQVENLIVSEWFSARQW